MQPETLQEAIDMIERLKIELAKALDAAMGKPK
jgi:hypothetical protein